MSAIEALRAARKAVKLAHDQYMGAGGNLSSAEVVSAMQRECNAALAKIDAAIRELEAQQPVEMSPGFTDTSRAALAWVLWHHQGSNSPVGQPIRFALGMGSHEPLDDHQLKEAKRWATLTHAKTTDFHVYDAFEAGRRYAAPLAPTAERGDEQAKDAARPMLPVTWCRHANRSDCAMFGFDVAAKIKGSAEHG